MKIRTDFVTNSSSSSFVAMLKLTLDNGKRITASAESSEGAGEGGWISEGTADYEIDPWNICSIDEFCNYCIEIDGQLRQIKYGSLRLMCHTYGEYAYEANPERLLTTYIGKTWGFLFDQMDKSLSEKQQFQRLRDIPFLKKYTDNSLKELIHFLYIYDNESESDSEIIQTLKPDGMLEIKINTGEDLFDTYDEFDSRAFKQDHKKGKLILHSGNSSQQKHVSVTIGRQFYSGTEDEISFILQAHKEEYAVYAESMKRAVQLSFDEYIKQKSFWDNGRIKYAKENLDLQEHITFEGKRFVISVNSESIDYIAEIEEEIKRRGGIPQKSNYGNLHPDTDYLVVSPFHNNFLGALDIKDAIKKRGEGYRVKIITDYQLWCGFMDKSIHVQSDQERMAFISENCSDNPELQNKLENIWETVCSYGYENAFRNAVENLDVNAEIIFMNKHFVVSGFGEEEFNIIQQIEERGGYVHDKMVKMADYLVICMRTPGSSKLQKALEWREKGVIISIVSEYQFAEAVKNTKPVSPELLRQREEDLRKQEEAKKEIIRQAADEREKRKEEQRKRAEERRRLEQEARERREEERRNRLDIARQQAEEKRRLRDERNEERLEKERLAAEAKAQKERERQEAIANATILYAPGQEPENIRRRIQTLCEKLDGAYPDRVISGLHTDHKRWGKTVTELYRFLGYVDSKAFLEAYGYTVKENKMGRTVSVDPVAITLELQHRYPDGTGNLSISQIKEANPDIPWKTLTNNSREYFGVTLATYLKNLHTIDVSKKESLSVISDSSDDFLLINDREIKEDKATLPNMPSNKPSSAAAGGIKKPKLTESDKKYLSAICSLGQNGAPVKAIDISTYLGISRQGVSLAIKQLCDKGYIYYDEQKNIHMLENTDQKHDSSDIFIKEDIPKLTKSDKKYLSAIQHLMQNGAPVKAIDISTYLGISRQGVSLAIKQLCDKGYIYYDDQKNIYLLDSIDDSIFQSSYEAIGIESNGDANKDTNAIEETVSETGDSEPIASDTELDSFVKESSDLSQHEEENGKADSTRMPEFMDTKEIDTSASADALLDEEEILGLAEADDKHFDGVKTSGVLADSSDEGNVMAVIAQAGQSQPVDQKTIETEVKNGVALQDSSGDLSDNDTADSAAETPDTKMQRITESEAQVVDETADQIQTADAKAAPGETEKQAQVENEEQKLRIAEERARLDAEKQKRQEAEAQARREAEEKASRETIEQAKRDAEEAARKAEEAKKAAEKARISAEILSLTNEMNSLRGLFAGLKRKKLQARIDELNGQLRRL